MRYILLLGLLASCAQWSSHNSIDVNEIYEQHWEWSLNEFPEWGTFEGRTQGNHRWSDRSFEAFERRDQYYRDLYQKLQSINEDQLDPEELVHFTIFKEEMKRNVLGQKFPAKYLVLNQLGGPHTSLGRTFQMMPKSTKEDLENILSRVKQLPNVISQHQALMARGLELDVTPPRETLRSLKAQFEAIVQEDFEANPLTRPLFDIQVSVNEELKKDYLKRLNQKLTTLVLPALKDWKNFVLNDYLPKTREETAWSALPDGEAWYAFLAEGHTTTTLTPQEIHEIGLNEVARIHGEMRELIARSDFKGTPEQFKADLLTNPKYYFDSEEELVHAYQAMAKRIDADVAQLFLTLPRTPYGVKAMEPHIAASSPAALYFSGNLNTGRSGTFYVNTTNLASRPKWEMEALTLHEAVPGHHLQIALAQEMDNVPEFRKRGRYTAFIEGWGLYAEGLGHELNLYQDPPSEFGRLSFEMWRAVRLVVDTGLHALGWSRDQAIKYFQENSGRPPSEAVIEVDRYIVRPGQALAYKIGELKIWELRRKAESALGERFDVREFHDEVLKHGAIPLLLLEENINNWIKEKM